MSNYAPIGRRFVAMVIDGVFLIIPSIVISMVVPVVGPLLMSFFYKPFFEASAAQATPGKRAMGMFVTTVDGNRLSLKAALIRTVVSSVSGLLFLIGHMVACFTDKKQALHDLLADSVVVQGTTNAPIFDAWADQVKALFSSK